MKIIYITFEYPPFILGGAGIYSYNLTKELAALGHEVHVITTQSSSQYHDEPVKGLYIHRQKVFQKPLVAMPSFWFILRKQLPSITNQIGGFDILHSEGLSDLSIERHFTNKPRVLTVHHLARNASMVLKPGLLNRIKHPGSELVLVPFIESICIKRADRIIAVSQNTKDSIIQMYSVPESKITAIHHGVHTDDYIFSEEEKKKARNEIGCNSDLIILFVGRLEARKGVDILIEAFSRIPKDINTRLMIAGAGDPSPYKKMATALQIADRVRFLGYVDETMLKPLYAACDLFVLPSRLEGLGMVLMEAMAAGKPVVATRAGGIPEIVTHGQNGFLVEPDNPDKLAQAITNLLQDSSRRMLMGQKNALQMKERYSWRRTAHQVEQVYQSIL